MRGLARAALVFAFAVAVMVGAAAVVGLQLRDNSDGAVRDPSPSSAPPSQSPTPPSTPPVGSDEPTPSSTPPPPLPGARFVVAPDGDDDGTGAPSDPWRTLEKALPSLAAGDTLFVRNGTYDEKLDDIEVQPGSPSKPVQVVAAPGSRPVLRGLLWLRDADHWSFRGLNVTWDKSASSDDHMVKFDGGTGWSFTDAEVSDARSYAAILVTGEAQDWRLSGLFVHSTQPTHGDNQDHLVYVSSTDGGVIERCLLTDSHNGRAIKLGPPDADGDPVENVTVRYNTMFDNLGPSNVQLSRDASDNRIYRNIMSRPGAGQPNVSAFELSGEDNTVYDNLVHESTGAVAADVDGLEDGGGNVERDPRFTDTSDDDFRPLDDAARSFGRYAPTTG